MISPSYFQQTPWQYFLHHPWFSLFVVWILIRAFKD